MIALNIVRFNQPYSMLEKCIRAALDQDLENFTVTLTENGSADSIREPVLAQFGSSPRFSYVENQMNLGFAGAHNRFFSQSHAEFVMPLNPDAVLSRILTLLIRAFDDPLVAAAEGKMIKPEPAADGKAILDGTGMVLSRSERPMNAATWKSITDSTINRPTFSECPPLPLPTARALWRRQSTAMVGILTKIFLLTGRIWTSMAPSSGRLHMCHAPDAVVITMSCGEASTAFKIQPRTWLHTRSISTRIPAMGLAQSSLCDHQE